MPYRLAGQKNFLQMQQEVSEICLQMSIADANSNPSLTRIKQIINDSYREIMAQEPWWFLYAEGTFDTVAGQITPYALDDLAVDIRFMVIESLQRYLIKKEMEIFRKEYPWGYTNQGLQVPIWYILGAPGVNNGVQVNLYPAADNIYTVTYGYKRRVFDLDADGDQPLVPVDFQDVIIMRACWNIFRHRNDERQMIWKTDYEKRYSRMWLENEKQQMEFKRDTGGSVARLIQPYNDYRSGV